MQVCYKTLPFFSIIDPIWSLGRFTLEIPWFPRLNLRCSLKFSHHPNLKNQHLKIGRGCEEHNESCVILSTLETNFTKIFDENFIFLVWTSSQLFRLASLIGKWNRIYFIIFRFFLKLNKKLLLKKKTNKHFFIIIKTIVTPLSKLGNYGIVVVL